MRIYILTILFLLCSADSFAQTLADLGFADHLYHQADYYRAVTEYQRLLAANPTPSQRDTLYYRLGWSYYHGHYWEHSIKFFTNVIDSTRDINLKQYTQLVLIQTYLEANDTRHGLFEVQRFIADSANVHQLAYPYYFKGWGKLKQQKWLSAEKSFLIAAKHSLDLSFFDHCQQLAAQSLTGAEIPQRSSLWAGIFSTILPGSGLIYAGETSKGFLALVLNGILAYYTLDAIYEKRYIEGGAIALLLWHRYYRGTVNNSIQAAKDYNQKQYQQFMDQVESNLIKVNENF